MNALTKPESYAVRVLREEVAAARAALDRVLKPFLVASPGELHAIGSRAISEWELLAQAAANVSRLDAALEALIEGQGADELHAKAAYELTGLVSRDESKMSAQADRRALAHVIRTLERVL